MVTHTWTSIKAADTKENPDLAQSARSGFEHDIVGAGESLLHRFRDAVQVLVGTQEDFAVADCRRCSKGLSVGCH